MRLPPGIVLVLLVLPARLPSAVAAAAATAAMLHASLPLSSAGKRLNNACIFPPFSHNFSVVFVVVSFSVFCFRSPFSAFCFVFARCTVVATGRVNKSATNLLTPSPLAPPAPAALCCKHTHVDVELVTTLKAGPGLRRWRQRVPDWPL